MNYLFSSFNYTRENHKYLEYRLHPYGRAVQMLGLDPPCSLSLATSSWYMYVCTGAHEVGDKQAWRSSSSSSMPLFSFMCGLNLNRQSNTAQVIFCWHASLFFWKRNSWFFGCNSDCAWEKCIVGKKEEKTERDRELSYSNLFFLFFLKYLHFAPSLQGAWFYCRVPGKKNIKTTHAKRSFNPRSHSMTPS